MDPRVWIHTKLSWIRNTACKPVKHVKYFDIIFLLLPRTCRNDGCDAHIIEDSITSVQGFGSQITGINHQIFIYTFPEKMNADPQPCLLQQSATKEKLKIVFCIQVNIIFCPSVAKQ